MAACKLTSLLALHIFVLTLKDLLGHVGLAVTLLLDRTKCGIYHYNVMFVKNCSNCYVKIQKKSLTES